MKRAIKVFLICLFVAGCAGFNRRCSSYQAETFGGDWIVVQYRMDGTPINCWKLHDTSITNEHSSDGIYWLDTNGGHLVHISGWYNRVQVSDGDYDRAAKLIGVNAAVCGDGVYPAK